MADAAEADALSQRAAPEQPPLPPSPFSSPRQKSQTKPDVLSFDGDDAPVRPPLEELIAQGDEILVPTDTTLEHAIASVNALGAAPCRIAIEAGDHHCNTVLEVSARHVAIRGLQKTNPMTDVVTHATVHGIWRLMKDSGGEFSDLRCVNRTSDQALLSVLGGSWKISRCHLVCGFAPLEKRPDGYRGHVCMIQSLVGGISDKEVAYGGIVACKDSVCKLEGCSIANTIGTAAELRDKAEMTMIGCKFTHNFAVFSAGYPNEATLVVEKNFLHKNQKMWVKSPPKNVQDRLDNVDITGYIIQIYPDI